MFSTQPAKRAFPVDELIIDFVLGCCLFAVLFYGEFVLFWLLPIGTGALGRFLFPSGALCAIELSYLMLGNVRGTSEGVLWLKALCISGAALMPFVRVGKLSFLVAGLVLPPAAFGLWLRRRGFALWRLRTISRGSD